MSKNGKDSSSAVEEGYQLRINRWSPHLLIIIILPFVLFWRWVVRGEVLYWGTLLFQFWPWHQLVKTSLLAGEWPLWNSLLGNGTPLLANLQSAVFYPLNLLYLLIPVEHGLTLSIILHLALAGVLMYLYAQQIGLNPFAATLSALTYMFSGYLIGRTQFVSMIDAAAWIPLLLLLCEKLARLYPLKTQGGVDILWLGLVLAMPILAGHAQLWFYSLWLLGLYTFVRSWQVAKTGLTDRPWLAVLHAVGRLGLALALAIMLSAAQLLPTAEFVFQSDRSDGAERIFALTYSFWPWRLLTLLAPNFFGHPARGDYWGYANFWEDHAYMGVLPVLLALVAIWNYLRGCSRQATAAVSKSPTEEANDDRHSIMSGQSHSSYPPPAYWQTVPFFALLIPLSLILAMGWNTPVYLWIFDTIPGFSYFQAPARLLIWYTVAVAVLAGVGAQIFELTSTNRPMWRRLLVASIGVAIAALAGSLFVSGRSGTFLIATSVLGVWLTLSIILLLSQPEHKTSPVWRVSLWRWAAIALVAIDLLLVAFPLLPMLPPTIFTQPITGAEFLKAQAGNYRYYVADDTDYSLKFNQYFRFETFGPVEMNNWQEFRETLAPNLGVYADLPSLNNDDPLDVGQWQKFTNLLETADGTLKTRLLGLAGVGYYVDQTGQNIGPTFYENSSVPIQSVPDPRPRAYFVTRAHLVDNANEAIARLTATDFDSQQEVVIIGDNIDAIPASDVLLESTAPADSVPSTTNIRPVMVSQQDSGKVILTVDTPKPGLVVLTDTFYPGWQATVNGQPAPIWPANLAFRAVAVEAGTHRIEFSYEPNSFYIGLWVSVVTLLTLAITGWLLFRNQKIRKKS